MKTLAKYKFVQDPTWQQLYQAIETATSLTSIVLAAWRMGHWIAQHLVEQQLAERALTQTLWASCSTCGTTLVSKGFVKRRMLTLVGEVEWRRRVGRCPNRCSGSHQAPLDNMLGIQAYQQTSTELIRLGCLLAIFLPFNLAAGMLQQLSGIAVSDDTLWHWVQVAGQQAMTQLEIQLQQFEDKKPAATELLDALIRVNATDHCR
jgi:hypothetical protein